MPTRKRLELTPRSRMKCFTREGNALMAAKTRSYVTGDTHCVFLRSVRQSRSSMRMSGPSLERIERQLTWKSSDTRLRD